MIIRPLINGGDKEQQRKEYIYPGTKQVEEIEKICGAAVTARQCQVVSERKRKRKKNRNSDKDRLFEGGKDKMESAGNAGKPLKDLENEIRGLRQSA